MRDEPRTCQNCKQEFTIAASDFLFYEKIKVPPPTFCPECRQQRRFTWRNERAWYSRKCDLCGKMQVGVYSPEYPGPVYCQECWWSDKWDPKTYGRPYDQSRPFFEQFKELVFTVPQIGMVNTGSTNSEYTAHSLNNKNCYFHISTLYNEDCYYGYQILESRDVMDGVFARGCELCYELTDCEKMYHSLFCLKCQNCNEGMFLYDCAGCTSCFMSTNLRNKQFVFRNEQLSKEEYERRMSSIDLGNSDVLEGLKEEYRQMLRTKAVHRFSNQIKCENSVGDHLLNCKNCYYGFDLRDAENCKYGIVTPGPLKDSYDFNYTPNGELFYEMLSGVGFNNHFSAYCWHCNNIEYCWHVFNSEDCFGCSGFKKAKYCILNTQYSEDEYVALRSTIITEMKKRGEYGEFFPAAFSPFGYNETIANDMWPMEKEAALQKGYQWRNQTAYTVGKETLQPEQLPQTIASVTDVITKEVLACIECRRNYKIVAQELAFYKKLNLPIPRRCFECRHRARMELRNPRKLWHRQCMCDRAEHSHAGKCANTFETTYAPERPEMVYCEQCYQAEVI